MMDSHSPVEATSGNVRNTILNTFLRGRPRNSSQSHIQVPVVDPLRDLSPSPPGGQPPSPGAGGGGSHRRRGQAGVTSPGVTPSPSSNNANQGVISNMLRRRRSAGQIAQQSQAPGGASPPMPGPVATRAVTQNPSSAAGPAAGGPPAHRIRLVPHLESRRSLKFDAISRDLKESDPPLRIGRFTDRSGLGLSAVNALGTNKLAFKSKVVSRAHAEIWVNNGKFFIKDTKSSSGTFLNHTRLSLANTESRAFSLKDGDLLQLGVDYQGGHEDIYKSVKIRVEIGREWQMQANAFNTNALKNLKALALQTAPTLASVKSTLKTPVVGIKSSIPDCCICLFAVTIQQALFISPCSHTFHYKCIRPLLESHHPAFSCPLCRTFADLEADVEVDIDYDVDLDAEATDGDEKREGGARGAETEVEGDTTPATARALLRPRPPIDVMDEGDENLSALPQSQAHSEEEDEEMVDLPPAAPVITSEEDLVLVDGEHEGVPPSPPLPQEEMGEMSDASASNNHAREFGIMDLGEDGERTVGSKRKR